MPSKLTPTSYAEITELFSAKYGVVAGKTFGVPTLKINGKIFAGLQGNEMIFKLTGVAHAKAMKLKGTKPFDPLKNGKVMKEWVQVPYAHRKEWHGLALSALKYVRKKYASI